LLQASGPLSANKRATRIVHQERSIRQGQMAILPVADTGERAAFARNISRRSNFCAAAHNRRVTGVTASMVGIFVQWFWR
jgi:hypothetical protein